MSQAKIADHLGVNKSTVSRELGRNSKNTARGTTYDAEFAQRIADKRRELKPRRGGMTYEIERRIRWLLKRGWSPEQINGTCKKRNIPMLSHEAIYLWIYERKRKGEDLTVHLRRKRKKRRNRALTKGRRVIIKDKTPIEQRPAAVAEQSRIGDFEVDLVKCAKGYLLTCTERKTLFNLIEKIPNKTADRNPKGLDQSPQTVRAHPQNDHFGQWNQVCRAQSRGKGIERRLVFRKPLPLLREGMQRKSKRTDKAICRSETRFE